MIVSLYFLLYWVFDILLELKLVEFIIIAGVIFINFLASGVNLLIGNKEFLLLGSSSGPA